MATSKKAKTLSCVACGLQDGPLCPKMEPYGDGKKGILVIGEGPSTVDDRKGMPWQGRQGRLLQRTLSKLGIDLFEDCVCVNAVNCATPKGRAPSKFEIDCCREVMVAPAIEMYKPKIIIPLGSVAMQSFIGTRWLKDFGGITKWRGFRIPDQDHKAWVVPAYHPSYVLRIDSREANTVWEQDLQLAVEALDMKFPRRYEPKIHYIEDLSVLESLSREMQIAIDYETTGLKAHKKGHRIVCAGVAANEREVYAFMMPKTKAERKPFIDLLTSMSVGKMAAHIKYEHSWTLERYGIEIQNWQWDTMLAAHHMDNRAGVTGLKFQTYVNFGVIIKDEDVSKFIYGKDESGNGFNKIYDLLEEPDGEKKLLRHVALDAHYEFRLALRQMEKLNYQSLPF